MSLHVLICKKHVNLSRIVISPLNLRSTSRFLSDGPKRYVFGERMRTERVIYEGPPPPPPPGTYPKKPKNWNLTGTKAHALQFKIIFVSGAFFLALAIYIMANFDYKMRRFLKIVCLTGAANSRDEFEARLIKKREYFLSPDSLADPDRPATLGAKKEALRHAGVRVNMESQMMTEWPIVWKDSYDE